MELDILLFGLENYLSINIHCIHRDSNTLPGVMHTIDVYKVIIYVYDVYDIFY